MSAPFHKLHDIVRGAWWTLGAVHEARRRLRKDGLAGFSLTPPPPLPARADRGMRLILGCLRPSCLERALVLQSWLLARGSAHDVVVGVRKAGKDFNAHAWIDAEGSWEREEFHEIARLGP